MIRFVVNFVIYVINLISFEIRLYNAHCALDCDCIFEYVIHLSK